MFGGVWTQIVGHVTINLYAVIDIKKGKNIFNLKVEYLRMIPIAVIYLYLNKIENERVYVSVWFGFLIENENGFFSCICRIYQTSNILY